MAKEFQRGNGDKVKNERGNGNVPWPIFLFVITIFTVVTGWLFIATGNTDGKIRIVESTISKVESRLATIDANVEWIKEAIKNRR